MAITMSLLNSGNSGGTSMPTGSFTPSTNTLVLAHLSEVGSSTPGITLPNGNGLTWVKLFDIETHNYGSSSSAGLWRAMASSPSSGSLTITASTSITLQWTIVEVGGVDTSGTNGSGAIVQTKQNFYSDTPATLALDATSNAANAIYGAAATNISTTFTHGTGYSTISTGSFGSVEAYMSQWLNGVAQTDVGFTSGGGANIRAFGVEIKASGGGILLPQLERGTRGMERGMFVGGF